jgi:hypothetical protein
VSVLNRTEAIDSCPLRQLVPGCNLLNYKHLQILLEEVPERIDTLKTWNPRKSFLKLTDLMLIPH